MSHRSRLIPHLLVTLFAVAAFGQAASCALEPNGSMPPTTDEACSTTAECDDQNPCTEDACDSNRICSHTPIMDGPLAGQVAGDCVRSDCLSGVVVVVPDDADVPNDNEACTTDSCVSGSPTLTPVANGTSCMSGVTPGACEAGACVIECGPGKPCDDMNPCTEDSCNAVVGKCEFSKLDGLPTPGYAPIPGDCLQHICVNGGDMAVHDDADVPDDNNPCSQDICTAGVPSNPPTSEGAPCVLGQPEVCDGQGACVACNVPADCVNLPPDDECQTRTCLGHVCGQTFTAQGTPIAAQTTGDCKRVVCNGTGSTQVDVDDMDLPNDNNLCTSDICTAGSPTNPNLPQGTSCGSPLVCNATGNCVGCNMPSDCPGTDDFCKTRTCVDQQCGWSYTPNGTDLPMGQTSMDCKVVECDGAGNTKISTDATDKPVDGFQCTQDVCSPSGAPSNPPEPLNTACSENGGQLCNGSGDCKKANSQDCAAASDCLSGFCVDTVCCDSVCNGTCKACNVAGNVGKCSNVLSANEDSPTCTGVNACDGAGSCKKDNGQACSAAADCVSGFCADGVCCESACNTACHTCNAMGSAGTCTVLVSMEDTSPTNICAGTKSCDALGVCRLKDGNACMANADCLSAHCVDSVCCNTSCTDTCKSCNLVGNVGTCSFVGANQDDVGTCSGSTQSCDGAGICKKDNGQSCAVAADCLSGFCVDGVCCNNSCAAPCQACSTALKGGGADGTCGNIAAGSDPQNECTNGSCNGSGSCKLDIGVGCSLDSQCLSGFCADGVCCNSGCSNPCQACTAALKGQGTDGSCGPIKTGADPDSECTPGSCNGAGACKLDLGDACTLNTDCLSGFCVDGLCCDTACSGSCEACSAGIKGQGSNGVCGPIKAGIDPANECALGSCNGSGACKLDNGSACSAHGDCLSAHCVDNVCCDTACSGTCEACSNVAKGGQGANGVCGPVKANADPANECAGASVCNGSGVCIGGQGSACTMDGQCITAVCVDGVCCDDACNGTCQACTNALKGSGVDGVCGNIAVGSDPLNECAVGVCDGAGMCIGSLGDICAINSDCLSGFCADGVCCNAACDGTCVSCNQVGNVGQCLNVPSGLDDGNGAMVCSGLPVSCDGSGQCKKEQGQACMTGSDCLNGQCVDGFCCGSASCAACESCGVTNSEGTCAPSPAGQDDGSCVDSGAPPMTCDGAGVCLGDIGAACSLSADCASGVCTLSVCDVPASCLNMTMDGTESAVDCGGLCLKCLATQTCNVNSDCLSGNCAAGVCQ